MTYVSFNLGALAPHIGEQLPQLDAKDAMQIEGHRNAINRLRINSIITRSEANKAEERLVKLIRAALKGKNDGSYC